MRQKAMMITDNSIEPKEAAGGEVILTHDKWLEFVLDVQEYLMLLTVTTEVVELLNEIMNNAANYSMEEVRVLCQMAERRCLQLNGNNDLANG